MQEHDDFFDGERLVRAREAARLLGVGRSKFYAMVKNGELDKPLHVSGRIKAWRCSELMRFVASRPRFSGQRQ
jgi:predicted DNA-binding transcriptional regulator AlpA